MNKIRLKVSEIYLIFFASIFLILGIVFRTDFIVSLKFFSCILYALLLSILFKNSNTFLRYSLSIPAIFIIYSNVKNIITKIHENDFDKILIDIDRWLFGINAPEIFVLIQNPLLTEWFQISYFLFYLFPVILLVDLLIRRNNIAFYELVRNVIFGFLLSYFLYLFVPAIGPRFTLYEYSRINIDLPGLYLTEIIRDFVDVGGGIVNSSISPEIQVNRDCIPSGHTMLTIIVLLFAFKFGSKIRYLLLFLGISIIIATVYLRYHYFVDILAGFIFAFVSIFLEKKSFELINR